MKKLSVLIAFGVSFFTLTNSAFAAPVTIITCPTTAPWDTLCGIVLGGNLFEVIITTAFIVASLIALAFLVFGGIKWITSGGDKAGVEEARNTIVAALVGLVIVFLAYFIINIVFGFFGLGSFTNFTLPTIKAGTTTSGGGGGGNGNGPIAN